VAGTCRAAVHRESRTDKPVHARSLHGPRLHEVRTRRAPRALARVLARRRSPCGKPALPRARAVWQLFSPAPVRRPSERRPSAAALAVRPPAVRPTASRERRHADNDDAFMASNLIPTSDARAQASTIIPCRNPVDHPARLPMRSAFNCHRVLPSSGTTELLVRDAVRLSQVRACRATQESPTRPSMIHRNRDEVRRREGKSL
jgi:hypothetical protein